MARHTLYENRVLHALLDSYENSLLSRGENKIAVHIAFPFTKKTMPEYFDESSLAYEEIHACMKELEQKGYVKISWKNGKQNHIIQKVQLEDANVREVYDYLKRTPKDEWEARNLQMLEQMKMVYRTPVAASFIDYLMERICNGKSVKEYIELSDMKRTEQILKVLGDIENNTEECYIREFSIRCLTDTKVFQTMSGIIGKIMSRFDERFTDMDTYTILGEYSIYNTPNYVYFKGEGELYFPGEINGKIDLKLLKQGVGLAGEDLQAVKVSGQSGIRKVITIENLTTFFRWNEEKSLIIYLGGYHNSVRRQLLHMIYEQMLDKEYLHFGDIDVGGFEIYEDLCRKTGIPFRPYNMGVEVLEKYSKYTKTLTLNDKMRLQNLIDKKKETVCEYMNVLEYMRENEVKLEQECVEQ